MESNIFVPNITVPEPRRLLIVDDDGALAKGLARLISAKIKTITATFITNPIEAQAIIEDGLNPNDLVLSDYHMPEMTGLELAEITLEIRRQKAIKFFIMSGAADSGPEGKEIRKAIGTYIEDYFPKPLDISTFKATILGVKLSHFQ